MDLDLLLRIDADFTKETLLSSRTWSFAYTFTLLGFSQVLLGASLTPEALCLGGESILHESEVPRIVTYCEQGQIVRREIFFKNSDQISSLQIYQNGHLSEQKSFSTSGNLGSWQRFEYISEEHWIKEKVELYGDLAGQIESREELINFNPYEGLDLDYQVIKRWFYTSKPHFHVEYVDLFTPEDQKRPSGKETYSESGELLSRIQFTYEAESEKPVAFSEVKADGEKLEYELYEAFDPEQTWVKANLSTAEIEKRRANLKSPARFKLAIIDSGFDYNHLELAHQWWQNPNDPLDGIDNDGNGWADDVFGWDQVKNVGLPTESSTNMARDYRPLSHGTHVAHIATRNLWGAALIGFAGDYTQKSYIEKISKFIKSHGVKIVNMSLGLPTDIRNNMGLRDAVTAYKKMVSDNPETLFIFASGNAGVDIDEYKNRQWPANIRAENTMTVGALNTDHYDPKKYDEYEQSYYSNYGVKNVDILTPGTGIEAASLGGGVIKHSGTSMATPFMVNLAAKLWMELPSLTASEVREIFIQSAYQMKSHPLVGAGGFADLEAARILARKSILAKRTSHIMGKKTSLAGPNCWNSALYMSGVNKGIHHTSEDEFRFILESPLCEKIDKSEVGALVALRRVSAKGNILKGARFSEVHGYTVLENEGVLSKNGTSVEVGYEKLTNSEVFEFYERGDKRACKITNIPREHCNLTREYYRCHSLETYLSHNPWPSEELRLLYMKVNDLELKADSIYLSQNLSEESTLIKERLQSEVDTLDKELETLYSGASMSEKAQFLLDYLALRLESLRVTQF